jgi:hypothetical protein
VAIDYENAVFDLEPYRTQWGHLPLVIVPFLAAFALVVLLELVEGRIPEEISTAILGAVGLAFAAFVLALPRIWRRWKARGRRELRLHHGEARVVDPTTGSRSGRCPIDAEHVLPGEYLFTVTQRFAGGTYRAPAVVLALDSGRVSVGAVGSRFTWAAGAEEVRRPDFAMGAGEWETLVACLGLGDRLAVQIDAKVR